MRERLSMNCELHFSGAVLEVAVQQDVERVLQIWTDCRSRFGADGPFLFGSFSAADAYYAPVVRRFLGFEIRLPDVARAYVETIDALPAMKSWMTAALLEHDFVPMDEPYRARPPR
jgi:glutathione S-transferase